MQLVSAVFNAQLTTVTVSKKHIIGHRFRDFCWVGSKVNGSEPVSPFRIFITRSTDVWLLTAKYSLVIDMTRAWGISCQCYRGDVLFGICV